MMWRLAGFVSHSYTNKLRVFAGLRIDSVHGAANETSSLVIKNRRLWSIGLHLYLDAI